MPWLAIWWIHEERSLMGKKKLPIPHRLLRGMGPDTWHLTSGRGGVGGQGCTGQRDGGWNQLDRWRLPRILATFCEGRESIWQNQPDTPRNTTIKLIWVWKRSNIVHCAGRPPPLPVIGRSSTIISSYKKAGIGWSNHPKQRSKHDGKRQIEWNITSETLASLPLISRITPHIHSCPLLSIIAIQIIFICIHILFIFVIRLSEYERGSPCPMCQKQNERKKGLEELMKFLFGIFLSLKFCLP